MYSHSLIISETFFDPAKLFSEQTPLYTVPKLPLWNLSLLITVYIVASSKHRPAVMIVWSHGCKATEDFVLILAAFLHYTGFTTSLDLLENNAIVEMGGTATYLINREENADFVIIVCSGEEGWYAA